MDDKLRLDGNAAAGSLREIFSFEVTTAQYACSGCGRTDRIGAAMVYEVRGLQLTTYDFPGFWESLGYHNYGDPWREQRYWGD